MDPFAILIIGITTFFTSAVGSMTGGTGLIATAVMLLFGMPAPIALGTRRVSQLGGTVAAFIQFHKHKKIDYKIGVPLILFSVAGTYVGVKLAGRMTADLLGYTIAGLLAFSIFLMLYDRTLGVKPRKTRFYRSRFFAGPTLTFMIVIISMVTGGVAGSLLNYVLIIFYAQTFTESAGTRKLPLIVMTFFGAFLFMMDGLVDYTVAVPVLFFHAAGAWLGSKYLMMKKESVIRWLFIAVSALLILKLLLD